MKRSFCTLEEKARWVWRQTIKLHKCAPDSRLASSLSDIEIFVVLYYAGILRVNPKNPRWEERDRLIISKGHGAISVYPVLADLGFFDKEELNKIGKEGSFLGVIPDTLIPGIETINGSLGHGLGVACGMALALKRKKNSNKIFVLIGDGEINEGAVWEAVMFAAFHKLNNLILIVDDNKISMLGYQKDILGLQPLEEKFRAFGWKAKTVDGHNLRHLYSALKALKNDPVNKPKVLVADTCKGKGVAGLEGHPLCHVKSLSAQEIDCLLGE